MASSSCTFAKRHYWGESKMLKKSLIAIAVGAAFSTTTIASAGTKSPRNSTNKCTSIQARCALEIGGECNPRTGRWRYIGTNWHVRFVDCLSRELARNK
jgi:hypothetical protein